MTSRGVLSGPAVSATSLGAGYRIPIGPTVLALAYDTASSGDQAFWSADLHYPIGQFEHGRVAVFAGWGGLQFRGVLGGTNRNISTAGVRVGAEFYYRLTVQNTLTPFYFTGQIASSSLTGPESQPIYLWTYSLAAGTQLKSGLSFEAGYRGAAARWRSDVSGDTFLRWDGMYLALVTR